MSLNLILALVFIGIGVAAGGLMIYQLVGNSNRSDVRHLMNPAVADEVLKTGVSRKSSDERVIQVDNEAMSAELKLLETQKKNRARKKGSLTLEERYAKAGMFAKSERDSFQRMKIIIALILGVILFLGISKLAGVELGLVMSLLGGFVGFSTVPSMILDSRTKQRDEEMMYYLPLVIEQISIGVSSSLDIGPCLGMVVKMADERGSHNPVTELIRHVQFYVKSGASLQEALVEVGELSGHTELNHTFVSLAQVAKHGGEITRQMQDLADAVSSQRETKIEERIRQLELKATGPVALVFVGFMIVLVVSLAIQVVDGLKKDLPQHKEEQV